MVGDADRVLQKSRVLVGIGMCDRRAKTLHVVVRHLMGIGPQGREFQACLLGFEGERIHLDGIEDVLSAAQGWKEVIDPGQQHIAAKLPGISFPFHAQSLRQMQAVLASLARQDGRTAEALDQVGNLGQRIGAVRDRGLQVARELRVQPVHHPEGKIAGQRQRTAFRGYILFAVVADAKVGQRAGGIEEDVVVSVVARRVQPQRKIVVLIEHEIQLEEAGIAQHGGWKRSGLLRELRRGGEYQRLVGGFIVARSRRSRRWLGEPPPNSRRQSAPPRECGRCAGPSPQRKMRDCAGSDRPE